MTGPVFDIVTVVFESEYEMLELQARSISRHVDRSQLGTIFVIDNSDHRMPADRKAALMVAYGPMSANVRIVSFEELSISRDIDGYLRQQLAKLLIAKEISSDWYLTLDAKNHFVAGDLEGFVFDGGGKPIVSEYSYRDHPLRQKFEHVLAYLDVPAAKHLNCFTPTVTPYPLYRQAVLDLISFVEARSGRSFIDEFVDRGLTEFFLYGAWLKRGPSDAALYHISPVRSPNVWPKAVNSGGVERAIDAARSQKTPLLTVHRKALWRIGSQPSRALANFWVERGLFSSTNDGLVFISTQRNRRPSSDRKTSLKELVRVWRKRIRGLIRGA